MRADTDESPFETLKAAIAAVVGWFDAASVRGVIIGGVAISFLGRPRTTRDVDGMVVLDDDSQIAPFLAQGADHGIVPRIADAIAFARSHRVLLLRHPESGIDIDVSCGCMPFESEVLDRLTKNGMLGFDVPLPTPEDMIVMKAVANRSHDWRDIEGLIDAHPDLDADRVLLWSRRFADIMETPEVVDQLEKLLRAGRSTLKNERATPQKKKSDKSAATPIKAARKKAAAKAAKKVALKKAASPSRKKPL